MLARGRASGTSLRQSAICTVAMQYHSSPIFKTSYFLESRPSHALHALLAFFCFSSSLRLRVMLATAQHLASTFLRSLHRLARIDALPITAWMATSNIPTGQLAHLRRQLPAIAARSRCTIADSASTGSALTRCRA